MAVPEAGVLEGLTGEVIWTAGLRRLLGKLAEGTHITVGADVVTLDFGDLPSFRGAGHGG